jgi:outer membrane protein assembly factor BamB
VRMQVWAFALLSLSGSFCFADWTTVRGNAARTGLVQADLQPPYRLQWARYFVGERLGSSVEPIVADGKLFAGTHQGNLYALDAPTGQPIWRYPASGALLHSPAYAEGLVLIGDARGWLHAVEAGSGKCRWALPASPGGFAASPAVADGAVFIGSRSGEFLAVDLADGQLRWRAGLAAPIRQTAACADGRVFVTAEDLRVRCLEAKTGKVLWTSEPLCGQTARDGYPVLVESGRQSLVVVRTNPVVNMARQIAQDRHLLCQAAGVDDSDWRKLDAWTKSDQAVGTPELWSQEQAAIVRYLQQHPEARTFFVLDAATGREASVAPVLWCAGCQAIGTPPVVLPDGRLLVYYRSAYGHWSHGVAPLVALGILNLSEDRITLLQHASGRQPPWNTFWGTADESQNFVAVGNSLLIVHQSTLSGLDFSTRKLFPIWGERDSWGGFRNLPWARNEWNGPARGGVAVAGGRLYWQTGSRLLCLAPGESRSKVKDQGIDGRLLPATQKALPRPVPDPDELGGRLAAAVEELLSRRWAPLYVEPGLAGREFFFDRSADALTAMAWAYPHLPPALQNRVKQFLAEQWHDHPPLGTEGRLPLDQGERREWFRVPQQLLTSSGHNRAGHPLANAYAVWLYADRCDDWQRVEQAWPQLKASFHDFVQSGWRLDPAQGDLFANRYLASLLAYGRMAAKMGDTESASQATQLADETSDSLVAWWKRSAERMDLPVIASIKEWDELIGRGNALFMRVVPHKAKLALLHGLTPEVAARVKQQAPEAVTKVWQTFEALCPTWHLVGEERQVHYGENFLDPPDFALDGFTALAWMQDAPATDLAERVDVPFCRADLFYITKLAVLLDRIEKEPQVRALR